MEANRERTLVGLFVLLAAGLFLGTMIVISGGLSGGTVPHRASTCLKKGPCVGSISAICRKVP